MTKILVTPRSLTKEADPALDVLTDQGFELVFSSPGRLPHEDDLTELLPGCAGYLAGVEPISAAVLEAAPDLKVISRNGSGINNIDMAAARRRNIRVLRAAGANARGVAELTVGAILALVRSIPFSDRQMKKGRWQRRKGLELHGRTLGVIGCGQIGQLVTQIALAMGMDVLAYDRYPDHGFRPGSNFQFSELDQLLSSSDIISCHCPEQTDGHAILNRNAIDKLKPGVFIVNTARASLIDGASVLDGLNQGRIAGMALDVHNPEPPDTSPLLTHDHVITTPHIGGYTAESVSRATRAAVHNLLYFFNPDIA